MRPSITILFCMLLLSFSCQQQTETPTEETRSTDVSPNIDQYKEVFDSFIDGALTADSMKIFNAAANDFMLHNMFVEVDTINPQGVLDQWQAINEVRSDQSMETVATTGLSVKEGQWAGEWILVWGNYSATDNASGESFVLPVYMNARMENGKLKQMFVYYDRLGFLEKIGFELKRKEP